MFPNREHFIQLVDAIQYVRNRDSEFSEVLGEYMCSYVVVNSHDDFVESVIAFAESCFGNCGLLHYFVFDLSFGETHLTDRPYYQDAGELYDSMVSKASDGSSRSEHKGSLDDTDS